MLYDRDIREPLFEFLEERYGKIRIIEEKRMGRSRADIVMVLPRAVMGIEIKSDADTYARLSRQVRDYDRYFDRNTVVVGSSHGLHIGEHVPAWWGIITVDATEHGLDFYVLREAADNPSIDMFRKLGLLWRPELVCFQEQTGMPKYREKSKAFVVEKILQQVPGDVLAELVSDRLFERDYTQIEEMIQTYREQQGKKPRRKKRGKK